MQEKWSHRADLAETAINDRHAGPLWSLPRTNLARVSWPALFKERLFIHWHYWWQAHYLDCQVDAALRQPTKTRSARIANTMRGIKLRQLRGLERNKYYDDKAWLALAFGRIENAEKLGTPPQLHALRSNLRAGLDESLGVAPWRDNRSTFYNVPTNGPVAIMLARTGYWQEAIHIVDWVFDNLHNDDGLIMDGMRMRMNGPEIVRDIHPYCQGVMLGASLEIALKLREEHGIHSLEDIQSVHEAERADEAMPYISRIRGLVHAIAQHMATPSGVIDWDTGDGDGGLFKGILLRYLADVAVRLPDDSPANRATRKLATRLVRASAESVWTHRLEVDGLPVFATDWTSDALLPHNFGLGPMSIREKVGVVRIAERDLSVQLSGWMALEAMARVALAEGDPAAG
ncbi:glycoside hydrolase family 76 protein [Corynebacterium pseudodiphtheriticum]|uniref:glycoside hydrolase family 76 protein n=1 Tax=Corynebacterium pseudodiphtheriticum TaxID=37637 RepID=UPI002551466B|nr:glycoside hydrolase family 76 protein [Corynebacterium pseudodiphtheriticum]MDK8478336.1 glycoside hydrolase family 76 protein [Corynebacterium pseudodiphtheriticum]